MVSGDENDQEGGLLFDTFENMQAFLFNCIRYGKGYFVENKMEDLLNFIHKMIEISKDIDGGHKEAIICF